MVTRSGADTGAFAVLLCDARQNMHVLWASMSETESYLYCQDDTTGNWSEPVDVVAVGDPSMTYLSAGVSDAAGTVHVIWHDLDFGGNAFYSQAPLRDACNPRLWAAPRLLAAGVDRAQLFVDHTGIVHLAYGISYGEGMDNAVYYTWSEDDGITWSQPLSVFETTSESPSSIFAAIAVDGRGRVHIGVTLRTLEYGVYSEVGYIRSPDGGLSWMPYETVQTMGTTFQGVSIITPYAFGDDEVHLTWHDPRRLHRVSLDGGETWNAPVEIMPLGAAFGGPNALTKDSAGVVHVVLATGDGVFSVGWDGREWGEPEEIDDRPIDPHGQHIAVCQGNQLHVTYYDRLGPVGVWYSQSEVNAPHQERQAWPTALNEAEVSLQTTTAPLEAMPTPMTADDEPSLSESLSNSSSRSSVAPIVVASAAALVVTGAGALSRIRKQRRISRS